MTEQENAIRQVLKEYAAAVYAKDAGAFASLYDDAVQAFDMWDAWSHRGIGAWRAMAEEWFASLGSERVVVAMDEVSTRLTPGLALACALVRYSAVSAEGKPLRSLENRITFVLEPRGRAWKIVHEHSSAPIDSSTLKATLRSSLAPAAAAGASIG